MQKSGRGAFQAEKKHMQRPEEGTNLACSVTTKELRKWELSEQW